MSDTVIKVENLSKSAPSGHPPLGAIRHQTGAPGGHPYTALRDVLANGVKSVASSVLRGASSGLRVGNAPPPPATRHSPPTTEEFWALNDVSFEVKQGAP